MIHTVQPLHIGNALRLFLEPPAAALRWKVLRKGSDTFTGPDDASALVAFDGDERVFVDAQALQNDVAAFYKPYYFDGSAWSEGPTAHGTPAADYEEFTTDVMQVVRDRLEAGLKVECDRGNFQPELGYIQVYAAAPLMDNNLRFPLVTVHLESEDPDQRMLGDNISGDTFDQVGFDWNESEGWWANVTLTIIGWSTNADERAELRRAIRRLIIGNMPVFDAHGFAQPSLSQQDIDAVNGEYGDSPVYQVMNNFSCLAPVRVGGKADAVTDVELYPRSTYG